MDRPYFIIINTDGQEKTVCLNKDITTIGRMDDQNDIALLPDPQKIVTRYNHCNVEIRNHTTWITDNSTNGTEVKRGKEIYKVVGEYKLQNEDIILIKACIDETGNPTGYWQLKFFDPTGTVIIESQTHMLEYDELQHKLFIRKGKGKPEMVPITQNQDKMLSFMIQKNKANNDNPVLCSFDDIISAIWGPSFLGIRDYSDVTHLVIDLRKKIEPDPEKPVFLTNVRGIGYQLNTNPIT